MSRTAVILFNLGGPDSLKAVRPFLFNLFSDPAIIRLPAVIRLPLAWLIARRRARTARGIYEQIGGRSPIVPGTHAQALALEKSLGAEHKVFFAMRYWRPFARDTVQEVKRYDPDRIVLLPLYPHYSTTTTASSLAAWKKAAVHAQLRAPTTTVCCYPTVPAFIDAHVALLKEALARCTGQSRVRVLFSAHGLPKKIVQAGDPYQWQVESTVAAVVGQLKHPGLDYAICYQSRVGPLTWIGPATDSEIRRAGAAGISLIVLPVAFVSEHSETLVELDIEYAALAAESGVPRYERVPALGVRPEFIRALAELVLAAQGREGVCSAARTRFCPADCTACPCKEAA